MSDQTTTQLDVIRAAIAALDPETRAAAEAAGLLRKAKAAPTPKAPKTPRPPKAVKESRECACGCGAPTKSAFAMGHDAKAKGTMLRAVRGTQLASEIGWAPTQALRDYVDSKPEWDAQFGAMLKTIAETR